MNDIVVVDASLAIKWVLIEEDSARATTLLISVREKHTFV
jgi:predicted nucleic acid-binding protein